MTQMHDDRLVVFEQCLYKTLAIVSLSHFFCEVCKIEKALHCSHRVMTQHPYAFGYIVYYFFQLLILPFKELMHGKKIAAFYIPMRISCFDVEYMFIR